jgi:hypothetical protein
MSITYLSQANKLNNKIGWTKGCYNISYSKSNVAREDNENAYYHKLHF